MTLLIVWEPVLLTDMAPPTSHALSRVVDRRAAQLWDPARTLSHEMRGGDDEVVWDFLAIYPPGARWEDRPPVSLFEGGPVVDVIDDVQRLLAEERP